MAVCWHIEWVILEASSSCCLLWFRDMEGQTKLHVNSLILYMTTILSIGKVNIQATAIAYVSHGFVLPPVQIVNLILSSSGQVCRHKLTLNILVKTCVWQVFL